MLLASAGVDCFFARSYLIDPTIRQSDRPRNPPPTLRCFGWVFSQKSVLCYTPGTDKCKGSRVPDKERKWENEYQSNLTIRVS